jgi:hypothetical protein
MHHGVERWIDTWEYRKTADQARQRKRCSVRKVNRDRVREVAHAAVLVFVRLAVPMSRSLKAERQYRDSHENGQQPQCCLAGDMHP